MPTSERPAPSPLTSLLRRWPLALALPLLLGALGWFGGGALPSTTTAEARVALGPGDMTSGAIAGFPEATHTMAEDYARWVTSDAAQQGGAVAVSGSPVPDSNVIRVEAKAADPNEAVRAAQTAADQLVSKVNEGRESTDPAKTLAQVQKYAARWSKAKSTLEVAYQNFGRAGTGAAPRRGAAASALTAALSQEAYLKTQLDAYTQKYQRQIAEASQAADLRVVQKAEVTKDSASSLRQRALVLGVACGLLLALVIATLLDRRRSRRGVERS